ncbi:sigma-70 family RNA polymerase sigma factor [bacterium]|nr:sigma-70 family RNA polymerase sigma factor [bacterium]
MNFFELSTQNSKEIFINCLQPHGFQGEELDYLMAILMENHQSGRMEKVLNANHEMSVEEYIVAVIKYYQLYGKLVSDLLIEYADSAWQELARKLKAYATKFLYRNNFPKGNFTKELAHDLAIKSAIKLQSAHYPYDVDFHAWLSVFAANNFKKQLRYRNLHQKALDDSASIDSMVVIPDEMTVSFEDLSINNIDLWNAVQRLNEARKSVILLKYFSGLDYQEIADKLDKNVNAVYNLHFQALADLRDLMK